MSAGSIHHYLLVFDHAEGQLIEQVDFRSDGTKAVKEYAAKEQEYRDRKDIEIVLVGSDSIETVRMTHANYFDGSIAMSKWLQGIVPDHVR
ncbi:hypothetical protein [Isoptericola aurantiacus]|uniref:hypothetical protein n=1 Tax=Isoptericola aurantiacus TaxID=3377839 RepID=UPI00383B07B4